MMRIRTRPANVFRNHVLHAPSRLAGMSITKLSPVEALRVIRAIHQDEGLTHALRGVLTAIVLRANHRTGQAWADYGSLHREFGYSTDTVSAALKAGTGKYIFPGPRGRHGAQSYYVRPLHSAESCEEAQLSGEAETALCSDGLSAPASEDKLAQRLTPTTSYKGPLSAAQGGSETAREHVRERKQERARWEAEQC